MTRSTLVFTSTIFFIIGFLAVISIKAISVSMAKPVEFTPQPYEPDITVPTQSLTGTISSLTGDVEKKPRNGADPEAATINSTVLESEALTTGATATISVTFPSAITITADANSSIGFLSTNPAHFLIRQDTGTVSYVTDETTKILSIRSLHALFSIEQSSAIVMTDPDSDEIRFTVTKGMGKVGYINTDNQTQTLEVAENQTVIFDDEARTLEVN